jgi:4-hydroxybenzoate polyprenyltransferase
MPQHATDVSLSAQSLRRAILISVRPRQWTKNLAVFAPLFFSQNIFVHRLFINAVLTVVAFCFLSSSIYVFNDLIDREKDRLHPVKRNRPIASGSLSLVWASVLGPVLALVAMYILWSVNPSAFHGGICYLALQLFYTMAIKQIAILDVIAIASGFVIRVATGAMAVFVPISNWLYICTFMLALFLAFSKRRAELITLDSGAGDHRKILTQLSIPLLNQIISIVTSATIVSFALYTMSEETIHRFGNDGLKFTIPCVIYGLFRYLYLIYCKNEGGSPENVLLTDIPLLLSIVAFCIISGVAIYIM